ncbi:transposase [Gallaecimonas kandeliae]|uniref:transposase n=1 Tax=Gallaecimonas kandeliae TaxID=3029055 RepID=UPI0026473BAD|nr:transposase [Gallaecimonas kandeliae]WKE65256.1 transposase [Gallaecimonas kandeliae]WKE65257.1 transposase [Gallaecimonas kandeliae]WKE65265.1 transposase [Gallaecimonas kandeliae]
MTRPRSELVSVQDTPYYHCICRCVRRAFLCGEDKLTGQDYSHRKGWVLARLAELQEVFTIELCAYAVMANHYHLVVHIDAKAAEVLADEDVIRRWNRLFSLPLLVSRYQAGQCTSDAEREAAQQLVDDWRQRLCDLSWFMRCLNEHLARKANEEDNCKGRFWESRFKSQAILDEAGLLACMAYVDLNPLRAKVVEVPEDSPDVSLSERLPERAVQPESGNPKPALLPFVGNFRKDMPKGIPFALADYLELVDWTGRAQRQDKRGFITADTPAILQRLGLDADSFLLAVGHHQLSKGTVIGHQHTQAAYAQSHHRRRVSGPAIKAG